MPVANKLVRAVVLAIFKGNKVHYDLFTSTIQHGVGIDKIKKTQDKHKKVVLAYNLRNKRRNVFIFYLVFVMSCCLEFHKTKILDRAELVLISL